MGSKADPADLLEGHIHWNLTIREMDPAGRSTQQNILHSTGGLERQPKNQPFNTI